MDGKNGEFGEHADGGHCIVAEFSELGRLPVAIG
jgi:hypothetical protein